MGIFNLFKGHPNSKKADPAIVYCGPTYLEEYAHSIQGFKGKTGQWKAKIASPDGNIHFRIRYYGQRHEKHKNLIVGTNAAPPLIFAVHSTTGDTILLFDGCRHGYNALFCDTYSDEQLNGRSGMDLYTTNNGNDIFEVTMTTYNNIDYEDEFSDQVDATGFVELVNGDKTQPDKVKRDGFGAIIISVTDGNGKEVNILSEELA